MYLFSTAANSSRRLQKNDLGIVANFVQEVKADKYFVEELPDFNIGHIDALFNYAGDGQLVYPAMISLIYDAFNQ